MVSWADIFSYTTVIIGVIGLTVQIMALVIQIQADRKNDKR